MAELADLTAEERIFPGLTGTNASSVLREIAERLSGLEPFGDAESLHARLMEREELCSTGVGRGVAIPHCKINGLQQVLVTVGISESGVDFAATDGKPVHVFLVVVSPSRSPALHLQSLATISRWVKENDPEIGRAHV